MMAAATGTTSRQVVVVGGSLVGLSMAVALAAAAPRSPSSNERGVKDMRRSTTLTNVPARPGTCSTPTPGRAWPAWLTPWPRWRGERGRENVGSRWAGRRALVHRDHLERKMSAR